MMALGARRAGVQEEARQERTKDATSATESDDSQVGAKRDGARERAGVLAIKEEKQELVSNQG